ncbi:MAG: S8 family serine peptidase, partial [Streptosporangiaceae bacterium]
MHTLHVTTAWDTTRGSGVTVAVLDPGVDPAQPDLTRSVTTGPDYTKSGRAPGGPFWGIHGTEIASLIAGHGHGAKRALGIIGIAPSAKILSVRVTLDSGAPQLANQAVASALPGAIARGIRWAVRHDATVIDLPLDPVTTAGAPGYGGSAAERAAVAYALSKHVVLVAPAGDEGAGTNAVNYPAAYPGVIAVGAFDQRFVKAPFSSRRPYVTVTAAGAGVTAATPSSLSATAYTQLNSTSAASAMVAGIVALIRAQFPDLTPAQVTRALTAGTVYGHGGRRDGSGSGSVDAAKALTKAAAIHEAVSSTAASGAAPPPTPSPAHNGPIPRNISSKLVIDAAIAGVVFLLLLGLIFAVRAWRRRHARSARLAEVRAATQVPKRKPVTAKKGKAKNGLVKKGPVKKGPVNEAPAPPRAPAVVGSQAPDVEAAPELQPAGFIPAPLSPAIPASASPTVGGSAPTGFTGASGVGGPSSPGFTGSSGFTGSAMSGSAGPASSGFTGSAMSGFAGSASLGFAGSASSGFAGSASSGFAGSASSGFAGSASS